MSQPDNLNNLADDIKEQILYLGELGVDSLDVKLSEARNEAAPRLNKQSAPRAVPAVMPEIKIPESKPDQSPRTGQSRLASLPSLSKRSAAVPGRIEEKTKNIIVDNQSEPAINSDVSANAEPSETIDQIRAEIGPGCTRCKLSDLGRSCVVNSTGNFTADLMFVGEAPGRDEDEQGFPFVGRAGKLLTDIMQAIGFNRDDVFIGNINRCRPPENRAPEPDETAACKPFLKREIAVVRPRVIVVLGATAAQNLLETKVPIGKLRGQFHDYLGTKVMPTFHPAYLLRDPHKKREVWEDMKLVRDFLAEAK